jgi:hypothetical protein
VSERNSDGRCSFKIQGVWSGKEEGQCFMKKNSTLSFLVIFAVGTLIGILGNAYFIFHPSNYNPSYDLKSLWDYWIFFIGIFIPLYTLYFVIKAKNLNAKIFFIMLFLLFIPIDYIFNLPIGYLEKISIIECSIAFIITSILIYRYHKCKFDLFDFGKTDKT